MLLDPHAVIVFCVLGSSIALGFGSWLTSLIGCIKRKKRIGKNSATNADINGEVAEINSNGCVKCTGTRGNGISSTPAELITSIPSVAVAQDKPGSSANSKTNQRVKSSHKEEVEGESHDASGNQARDSEAKDKQKASKESHKKSNQKILDEREDKIAKGFLVRRQSDYPAMDDILSDCDESESGGKKSRSKKESAENCTKKKKKTANDAKPAPLKL